MHFCLAVATASLTGACAGDIAFWSTKNMIIWNIRGGSQAPKIPPKLSLQISLNDTSSDVIEIEAAQFDDTLYEENFVDLPIPAQFIADTKLPNDIGQFRLRAYRIEKGTNEFTGTEPCVIYSAETPPFGQRDVPIRVHDQCVTSEVFGSQR
jgi:GTP cyclohydrolase II